MSKIRLYAHYIKLDYTHVKKLDYTHYIYL